MNPAPSSPRQIYCWALLLAALTIAGLLFALFGDGIRDAVAWLILLIPLTAIVWNLKGQSPQRK